ncbi:LysR family transcriptional regulator [Sinomonas albida]|uniref:LysR family transcriptional regulator n=1 Tax=Sinomonas albida TaxID=369942 RepID=UPI0010A7F345|nr:LysR family transcriptional regulator [Sinomonas albida]
MARSFTLVQLRYFASVAETENMTESAGRLNISQSALSSAVSQLEKELGAQLFMRRHQRGIVLTDVGRLLAQELRPFLDHADRLFDVVHGAAHELDGDLTVGMFAPFASFRAPLILKAFEDHYPKVRVTFIEGDLAYLGRALLDGRCEIALMYDIAAVDGLETTGIEVLPPHVILPADHPLAGRPAGDVSLDELADEPLILLDLPHTREYVLDLFTAAGITPFVRHRVSGYETVRSYVAGGFGYSILNQRLPGDSTYLGRDVAVRSLRGRHRPIRAVLARPVGLRPTRRARAFEEVCRRLFSQQPSASPID